MILSNTGICICVKGGFGEDGRHVKIDHAVQYCMYIGI